MGPWAVHAGPSATVVCAGICAALCGASLARNVQAGPAAEPEAGATSGRYLDVGDARIYHEVHGRGEPIALLHGGLFGSIGEFKDVIADLSPGRMVIAIATRGHGPSELGTRPLSYRLLAEDAAAVIRSVTPGPVDILGFSDGAITGYRLTIAQPGLVRRLAAVGGPLNFSKYSAAGQAEMDKYDTAEELERLAPDFVRARKASSPDEATWNRFLAGLVAMWRQPVYVTDDEVRSIRCPVLIAAGDRDEYTPPEHAVSIYRLLPQGQLALVPGAGHTVFASRSALMLKLVRDFLAD